MTRFAVLELNDFSFEVNKKPISNLAEIFKQGAS